MKKLWARWAALAAFVIVLGVVFVNLGQWQLRRLDERRHRNDIVAHHRDAPVADFPAGFEHPVGEDDQWRRVRAVGEFEPAGELIVRYRHLGGKQGVEVVTPLRTEHGQVLVDRGFQPLRGSDRPSVNPAPGGRVTVVGYTRRDEQGPPQAMNPVDGQMRLINSRAVSRATGATLAPGYLSLISVAPAQDPALVALTPPGTDEGPHLSYALQWFSFTVLAAAGFFVFVRADLRDRKRARASGAPAVAPVAVPASPASSPSSEKD